jgi:hypothetical protein
MRTETRPAIYDRDGDLLMQEQVDAGDRLILVPDSLPGKVPNPTPRLRIMWGQHLLDDLVAGRYRSFVCAVNAQDNSRGIISQVAQFLSTSQWDERSITQYARHFEAGGKVRVLKFDMDRVEVLGVLRPARNDRLTLADLSQAMRIVVEMLRSNSARLPSASVSFLEARANVLVDKDGKTPSFEAVLKTMFDAGYNGDVYPSPALWRAAPTAVFARYPFSSALDSRREGGF